MTQTQPKISQVIENIITHPKDTITVQDLQEQFPDWKKTALQNHAISATKKGYLKPLRSRGRGGRPQKYEIINRDPYSSRRQYVRKKPTPKTDEVTLTQLGESVFMYIEKLKRKIFELGEAYSELQNDWKKEKASSKSLLDEKNKEIAKLEENNKILRNSISSKTFKLSELASFR